jgi:HEAT repeats
LIPHLDDTDWSVKWSSAIVLGEFQSKYALPTLLEGLTPEKNRNIRIVAARLLSNFEDNEVIIALEFSLNDLDYAVRRSAAISLAQLNQQSSIPELIRALWHYYPKDKLSANSRIVYSWSEDRNILIEGMTFEALRDIGDKESIRSWLFEHGAIGVRDPVADALGRFDSDEVIDNLFSALDSGIKAAALPLAKLGKLQIKSTLIDLLQDSGQISSSSEKLVDSFISLISLGSISIISELISILQNISEYKDTDFYFRNRVAGVLLEIDHTLVVEYLPELVRLLPSESGEQASWVIESIQSRGGFYNYDIAQSPPPEISTEIPKGGNSYNFPSVQKVQIIEHIGKSQFITPGK